MSIQAYFLYYFKYLNPIMAFNRTKNISTRSALKNWCIKYYWVVFASKVDKIAPYLTLRSGWAPAAFSWSAHFNPPPLHLNPRDKLVPLQPSMILPRRSPKTNLGAPSSDFAFENAVIGQILPKSNLPCIVTQIYQTKPEQNSLAHFIDFVVFRANFGPVSPLSFLYGI